MSELDVAWQQEALMKQVEGIHYRNEVHAVWSSMSATIVEAVCITPSSLWDEAHCSRMVVMLVQDRTRVEIGPHHKRRQKPTHDTLHQMSFGPPGARQWGFFNEASERMRWIVLQFDMPALLTQLGEDPATPPFYPRYMFFDPQIMHLIWLIEAECATWHETSALYADTLALGLIQRLTQLEHRPPVSRTCYLGSLQKRRLTEYLRAHLADNVRLGELAALVGFSPAHFCRAFKASVGIPPHAWQLRERIRVAQIALRTGATSLADLALSIGFVDQAHFTKVFTRVVGVSPHSWRRMQRN